MRGQLIDLRRKVFRVGTILLLSIITSADRNVVADDVYQQVVAPILTTYCVDCHSGDDANGKVDFESIDSGDKALKHFKTWARVVELVSARKMPPEDEPQPTAEQIAALRNWYRETFVNSLEARPGVFRPRRLSATEYRNTLRSLFGFDLEVSVMEAEQTITERSLVLKLLPTDPPGASRFRNDTYSNPLSTQIWEQYSYLIDFALEEFFQESRRAELERFAGRLEDEKFDRAHAETLLRNFVVRAWRRDIDEETIRDLLGRLNSDDDPAVAVKRELKAVLMSPQFMYRGLLARGEPGAQQEVDDFELAERLSYFIWADMPDDELFESARTGQLREPEHLRQQMTRMLDSPKASSLATDFATQWLTLDEIDQVSDNPPYMVALKSQPIDFFQYLVAEDRPLIELIDSKITFANPLTRRFYIQDAKEFTKYRRPKGIEIEIVPNNQITLKNTKGRGGILTMPGILAMNRGPILRGVWMLERIMGEHLSDPPPDVGQVKANIPGEELTFRERFALHRENESCAICHDKIDPLGFALEAYDAKGAFLLADDYQKQKDKRAKKPSEVPVTSGKLPSGETFADFGELKHILVTQQKDAVLRNIVEQMLAYALCRKLEVYDQPTVRRILSQVANDGTYRDLVFAIANSLPFREALFASD